MKERRDKAQKTSHSTKNYSNATARGRMDTIGVMSAERDECLQREMGDVTTNG